MKIEFTAMLMEAGDAPNGEPQMVLCVSRKTLAEFPVIPLYKNTKVTMEWTHQKPEVLIHDIEK